MGNFRHPMRAAFAGTFDIKNSGKGLKIEIWKLENGNQKLLKARDTVRTS